jgi:hypothetical protein
VKAESKLWQKVKKNTPNIIWTRVESWASFGFPDLVGYTEKGGFFTVELKVTKSNKITFSPHQIAFHVKHPEHTWILAATKHRGPPNFMNTSSCRGPWSGSLRLVACGLATRRLCPYARLSACFSALERLRFAHMSMRTIMKRAATYSSARCLVFSIMA